MKNSLEKINYFTASFLGILGLTLIYEIISEDDFSDKLDDIGMLILGIFAIWWYKKYSANAKNKWIAAILVGIGVLLKIMAITIEHADSEAVGDDIGILVSVLLAFFFVVWQTSRLKNK